MKKYDIQISNIKGLLIFLVLLGHYLIPFGPNQIINMDLIYSFHMPAFIFFSGLLSQKITIKKIKRLLAIFIIFQPLFLILGLLTGYYRTITWQSLLTPAFHLWYLLALVAWMIIALLLSKIGKHSLISYSIVFILVALALANRFFYGSQIFTITRILSFSPYFFAGYYLTPEFFSQLSNRIQRYRLLIYPVAIALALASVLVFRHQPQEYLNLFYGFVSKNGFSSTTLGYVLNTTVALVLGFVWITVFTIVVPKKHTILTDVGNHTLWIYILHPIIFYLLMTNKSLLQTFDFKLQLILAILLTNSVYCIFSMFYRKRGTQ